MPDTVPSFGTMAESKREEEDTKPKPTGKAAKNKKRNIKKQTPKHFPAGTETTSELAEGGGGEKKTKPVSTSTNVSVFVCWGKLTSSKKEFIGAKLKKSPHLCSKAAAAKWSWFHKEVEARKEDDKAAKWCPTKRYECLQRRRQVEAERTESRQTSEDETSVF
jgi:hypothetical protein